MPECLYEVEWGGFLTNHLSHGRWAMAQIGTPEALQQRYTELYKTRLTALATSQQRPQSPTLVLTEAEVGALRGTRQRYADQRAFFAEEIQNKGGVNPTLLHYLPQLLRGLAGAALYVSTYLHNYECCKWRGRTVGWAPLDRLPLMMVGRSTLSLSLSHTQLHFPIQIMCGCAVRILL